MASQNRGLVLTVNLRERSEMRLLRKRKTPEGHPSGESFRGEFILA